MRALLAFALLSGCLWSKHHYPDGRGLEGQLEREVVALNQRVILLEQDLSNCAHGGEPGPVFTDLHQVFSSTEIALHREGAIIVVTIPIALLFSDPFTLRFREEALATLDLLSMVLRRYPNQPLHITGHTDDRTLPRDLVRRFGSHLDLSFQYAAALTQHLTETHDMRTERFTVAGKGPWAPRASNDTPHGQAQNQRVEVRIYPPTFQ